MIREIYFFLRYGPRIQKLQKELGPVEFFKNMARELDADGLFDPLGGFDLCEQHIHGVDVGRRADLGNEQEIQFVSGLLHEVHDIPVHIVGIEAVDAYRN